MSCLSDIDLATLHQLRLNERVDYKLSWWNRPTVVGQQRRNHEQQQPKAKVQADQRRTYGNRKANKMARDSKNQCVEHVKNDANGMHDEFPNASAHQSRCKNGKPIDTKCKDLSARCFDESGTSVKMTATGSCDNNGCATKVRHPTTAQFDCNANKLCYESVNDVVNESGITIDDDHFPILRRRRSGTWP